MSALLLLTAGFFTGGPILLAVGALFDVGRRPGGTARRVWQGSLLASILTAPMLPGIPVASAPRVRIVEGPDLLSGEPLVRSALPEDQRLFGLIRVEGERVTQGGRLLREERRDVVSIPLLPLLLAGGWFLRSGRMATVAVLALVLGGCAPNDAPLRSERIALELLEVWRTGDAGLAGELFTGTAVYRDMPGGFEARGLPEIMDYLGGSTTWANSLFVDVVEIRAGDGWAAVEWIREGFTTPEGDGAPTRFTVEGVTLIEIEGQRIVSAVDYADPTGLIVARGGTVVLPDGTALLPVRPEDPDPGVEDGGFSP